LDAPLSPPLPSRKPEYTTHEQTEEHAHLLLNHCELERAAWNARDETRRHGGANLLRKRETPVHAARNFLLKKAREQKLQARQRPIVRA
tara:strand:- start:450 stop:716 length:267 start_codon:yes stop_codon:yes gene_type:complete